MLTQAENKVRIEGILSEIDIADKPFVKNGITVNAIGGSIKIRVNQKINGEDAELEIPVHMFSAEKTNSGAPNPAYDSIKRLATEFNSIAVVGIDNADRVRITSGSLEMNEYYSQSGALVSFPRIKASFITKIKKDECKPEASFSATFVVGNSGYEVDKDGIETDKYKITAIIPQYGGKVDVIPMVATNKGVIDAVSNYWHVGDTVKASGKLNFSSKTETTLVEVDFGEPIEQTRTISVSELIITGGSSTPMEGDYAINADDVQTALAARKERLAELKVKATEKKANNTTTVVSNDGKTKINSNQFDDLGF